MYKLCKFGQNFHKPKFVMQNQIKSKITLKKKDSKGLNAARVNVEAALASLSWCIQSGDKSFRDTWAIDVDSANLVPDCF